MIWEGEEDSLVAFMDRMNLNDKNIVLAWKNYVRSIVFLDLEIMNVEGKIH